MELELVVGTIRKGIKSTIEMHILIFDIGFKEKVKNYFLFSAIFVNFFKFYPKNPKRPNRQSANMAHFVAFRIGFQKNIPLKYQGVFVKHWLCPRRQQSPKKAILIAKVKVKVTRSLTLVSFERASLLEYACQIWSLYL